MSGHSKQGKSFPQHLWGFLTSRKVAVALMLGVLALLLLGLWMPQIPRGLDAAGLAQWRATTRDHVGPRLDLYERLGLTDLYHTPTFLGLLAALLLNTLLCTLDRLRGLWRAMRRRPVVRLPDTAYDRTRWQIEGISPQRAGRTLRRFGCRLWHEVHTASTEGVVPTHYFHLAPLRWTALGSLLTHLGLLLFVLAALLHTLMGWRERLVLDPAISPETAPTAIRQRPTCSLLNTSFEPDRDGSVFRGARGSLLVQEGNRAVRGTIALGTPIAACGATILLDSYGLAVQVEAIDRSGEPLEVRLPVTDTALLRFGEGDAEATADIPAWGLHMTLSPSRTAATGPTETLRLRLEKPDQGQVLFEGLVAPGRELVSSAGQISFRTGYYLSVEVVHDPGFPAFLAAGLAVVMGSSISLLLPRRRLWARLDQAGTLRLCFGTAEEQELQEWARHLHERLHRGSGGSE